MKPILLSIRNGHADNIMAGTKIVEFRRSRIEPGTTVVTYRSGDADKRGIVGTWVVRDATHQTPTQFRAELTDTEAGLPFWRLAAYAGGPSERIWGMGVSQVDRYWSSLPLSAIGIGRAPQSFMYLTDEQVATLREMAEVPF